MAFAVDCPRPGAGAPMWVTPVWALLAIAVGACGTHDPTRPPGDAAVAPEARVDLGEADARPPSPDAGPGWDGEAADTLAADGPPALEAGDGLGAEAGPETAPDLGSPPDEAPALPALLPLRTGNRWEYEVREPGQAAYAKTQVVEALEAVGGRGPSAGELAYRMVTTKRGGPFGLPDRTVSWQRLDGTQVVRFRELAYRAGTNTVNSEDYWTPFKVRVDSRPEGQAPYDGQRWDERYVEHKVAPATGAVTSVEHVDTWTVLSTGVAVTVGAGSFTGCVELKKTGAADDAGKTYVFCPGVGKVKELGRAGSGQSEVLTAFQVSP